ncbi:MULTISPECIES: head-tail adaptor protein [Pirellulaceae]|nr:MULTISPECIES: head-tail adaptor protein [Pirellulaceae]
MTPAGEFNKRVTYSQLTGVDNHNKKTYSTVGTYWAKVTSSAGGEKPDKHGTQATRVYVVRIRNNGIEPKAEGQLLYKNKTLHIASVFDVDEEGVEWELSCTEVV